MRSPLQVVVPFVVGARDRVFEWGRKARTGLQRRGLWLSRTGSTATTEQTQSKAEQPAPDLPTPLTDRPFAADLGHFPLGPRQMATHSMMRRHGVQATGTSAYQGEGGRVAGLEPDGESFVPSVLIYPPRELAERIHAGAVKFRDRLPAEYRDLVEIYPVEDLHATIAHGDSWDPKSGTDPADFVRQTVSDLHAVTRRLRPFEVKGLGFESLPNVGIWRIMVGGDQLTRARAAILQNSVHNLGGGVLPYTSPIAPKIDGRWGATSHITAWIYRGHIPGEVIREAMLGLRKEAKSYKDDAGTVLAPWVVGDAKLVGNGHRGGVFFPVQDFATFEFGHGLRQNTVGLEVTPTGHAVPASQGAEIG